MEDQGLYRKAHARWSWISFTVYLAERNVQELDALWTETMVSGSLLGPNACDDAKKKLSL